MYEVPGVKPYTGDGLFRGPGPISPPYIAFVGAAFTFGRFCAYPFPSILAERLGIGALNLGYGAAGPTFPSCNAALMEYINRAELVIVQVMSGRSESNRAFRIVDHCMRGVRTADNRHMTASQFWGEQLRQAPETIPDLVSQTRANYVLNMKRLLNAITSPKILFWFSVRAPHYSARYDADAGSLFGAFPHLIDETCIAALRSSSDAYVESIGSEGLPQPLLDQHGKPTSVQAPPLRPGEPVRQITLNTYYPSPEMHLRAADLLEPVCRCLCVPRGADL